MMSALGYAIVLRVVSHTPPPHNVLFALNDILRVRYVHRSVEGDGKGGCC